jgi:transcriptional regulator with XRE-family HTH domain
LPSLRITDKQFTSLFSEVRRETKGFTQVGQELLVERPGRILVLRVLLGVSQPRFEAMLGRSHGNITKYENGSIETMRTETASRMIEVFLRHRSKSLSLEAGLRNLGALRAESKGWFHAHEGEQQATSAARKGAVSLLAKTITDQEHAVLAALSEKKFVVKTNFPLDSSNSVTADIYIMSGRVTVIQCRKITSENRNTHRRAIEDLAYQGFRIRRYVPKASVLAFLESKIPLTNAESDLLNEVYDSVAGDVESLLSLLLGT